MREIKFRAWDKELNKMIYPKPNISTEANLSNGKILDRYEILMQYTGLHDKNGKEIYEGDIVQSCHKYIENIIGEIRWSEKSARFLLDTKTPFLSVIYTANIKNCEIIGNIYENQELLERSK